MAFLFYLRCLNCRKYRSIKAQKSAAPSDYFLNKGISKLEKDLDVVGLVKRARGFEILSNILFSRGE